MTGGDYNSKYTLWGSRLTTKRKRIIEGNPRGKLFISINKNTNILAYWRKQSPGSTRFLCNQWNLLNIYRHTIKLPLKLGPFSNSTNNNHISISQEANTTLHNSKTNWDKNRQILQGKVNLSIILKEHEDIELETNNLTNLLKSCLSERQFETKINGETPSRFHTHSGVLQRSILGPLLYVLYTYGLQTFRETTLGTFAGDTAIFATHEDPTIASLNLQEHLHVIEK